MVKHLWLRVLLAMTVWVLLIVVAKLVGLI